MQEVQIHLPTPRQVQQFAEILQPLEGDFEFVSGKHILDARSLMGIFSLDLSHPLRLRVYNDCPQNLDAIRPFLADEKERLQ